MIPKRYRAPLVIAVAASLALGIFLGVPRLFSSNPYRERLNKIREGMTVEEAIGIMGRPPDSWGEMSPVPGELRSGRGGSIPNEVFALSMVWEDPDGKGLAWVDIYEGKVTRAYGPEVFEEPFWNRVRRWFHR